MANIDPMQQEAMRRVQAMQSRAVPQRQSKREEPPHTGLNRPVEQLEKPEPEHKSQTAESQSVSAHSENRGENVLDILFKDKEQNLILMLILLLAGDGADSSLLLALIYLLI